MNLVVRAACPGLSLSVSEPPIGPKGRPESIDQSLQGINRYQEAGWRELVDGLPHQQINHTHAPNFVTCGLNKSTVALHYSPAFNNGSKHRCVFDLISRPSERKKPLQLDPTLNSARPVDMAADLGHQ